MRTFRILAALVMTVVCMSLSSCSKDDNEEIGSTDDLVGKWELTWTKGWEINSDGQKEHWDEAMRGQYFVFKNDGTGYNYEDYSDKAQFTWKLEGKKLNVTYTQFEGADVFTVETLNETTLTITKTDDDEVDTSTYKKIAE